MTNTQVDIERDIILQTWSQQIICGDCTKLLGYSDKFMATQFNIICDACLKRALE